jgi:homoserine acetyltransferase
MKQIVLQLDSQRYLVLTEALKVYAMNKHTVEKCKVIAEQLEGLVTTQWTGSRTDYTSQEMEVINEVSELTAKAINAGAVKSNIMPIHRFVPSKGKDNNCNRCGLAKRHKIHNS